jgi:hypothetical protein
MPSSQTQAARVVQDRILGQKFQCVRMMLFANFAQVAVARLPRHTTRQRLTLFHVVLCPEIDGGNHDDLVVSTAAAADCATAP